MLLRAEDSTQKYRIVVDNKKVILRLIDTPGLLALDSLTKEVRAHLLNGNLECVANMSSVQYLLPMQGFILVYSVTSRESFTRLEEYKRAIYKHKTETKIPIVIVGNKSDDRFGRQVSFEEGKLRARQLGASFFELSSKNDPVEAPFAQCVKDLQGLYEAGPILTESTLNAGVRFGSLLPHPTSHLASSDLGEPDKTGILQHNQKRKWRHRTFSLKNGVLSYSNVDGGAIKGSMNVNFRFLTLCNLAALDDT